MKNLIVSLSVVAILATSVAPAIAQDATSPPIETAKPDKPKAEWVDGEAVFMNAGTPRRMDCSYELASALIKFKARFTITRRPTRSVKILKS